MIRRAYLLFATLFAVHAVAAGDTKTSEISDAIDFEFALYFVPNPAGDPEAELKRQLKQAGARLRLGTEPVAGESLAVVDYKWSPIADYAPPTQQALQYFGIGVDGSVAQQLAAAERVFIVRFVARRKDILAANHAATELMAAIAERTHGYLWDEETRQLFSLDRWRGDRIESWQDDIPDMRKQVTMHAYANPKLIRIITLGMRKFGLPDLTFPAVPGQHSRAYGNIINAVMQRLAEGQQPQKSRLRLTLAEIQHRTVRAEATANPGKNAKGTAMLSFESARPDKGDPTNQIWEIDFPEAGLRSAIEREMWGADQLFGSTDQMINAKAGDPELEAASQRARAAFFAEEKRFRAGLAFKERLLVKAPFKEGDQTEYMWVEVVKWGPTHIEGILTSDPYYVKSVRAGSRITTAFADIYDYLFYKADGTEEGNETGKVLLKREQSKASERR